MSSFRGFGTMQFSQGFRGMSRSFTAMNGVNSNLATALRTVVVLSPLLWFCPTWILPFSNNSL